MQNFAYNKLQQHPQTTIWDTIKYKTTQTQILWFLYIINRKFYLFYLFNVT